MMRFVGAVCLLASCFAASAPVSAQISTGGSVRGHVKDEQDAVLRDTRLTAVSGDAPGTYTATSDENGYYRLLDLAPGEYSITAEHDGFAKWTRTGVQVRASVNLDVPVIMKIGSLDETVQVTVDTPMLESRMAATAINVDGELQRALPLSSRRNWSDSLLITPGVVAVPRSNNFSLHGADFSSLVLQLDGSDVSSTIQSTVAYVNLSTEAISDVQVKTGGVDASVPLGVGAVVSVASQSGTNQLRGAATVVYQPWTWSDRNTAGGTSASSSLLQPDIAVGGPVKRDRAWFFGSYRYTSAETGVTRTAEQVQTLTRLEPRFSAFNAKQKAHYSFLKSAVQVSPSHSLSGFYQRDYSPREEPVPTESAIFSRRIFGGIASSVRLSSTWGTSLTTRLSASYNNKGIRVEVFRDDVPSRVVFAQAFSSSGRLVGNGQLATLDNRAQWTEQPSDKLTLASDATYFSHGRTGAHEFQAGVYFQPRIRDQSARRFVNGGFSVEEHVLRDSVNPTSGTIPFHRVINDSDSAPFRLIDASDYAVYAQDAWSPTPRTTIHAGVRIDVVRRSDTAFKVAVQDSVEVGPRFGISQTLTGDGKTIARASWVRVHDVLSINSQGAGAFTVGRRDLYDLDLNGTFETAFVTPGVSALSAGQVNLEEWHQPYVNELSVGVRRQLPGAVSADVGFVRRDYRDRTLFQEINGIYQNILFGGYLNEAANEIYRITNNIHNWPVYSGVEFQVSKQTNRLQLLGSYTRQWRHLAGTWQPNDPASFVQPEAFDNDRGIGHVRGFQGDENSLSGTQGTNVFNWRDHIARLAVSCLVPGGFRFASTYAYQSGYWSGPLVTRIAAPDPRFGPSTVRLGNGRVVSNPLATVIRFANDTRGDGQFTSDSVHYWNLRIGRDWAFGGRRLEAAIDVFNLNNMARNEDLEVGANQTYSPNFRRQRSPQLPRSGQLSLRFLF